MSELTLFYILVAIAGPILLVWLVCWLCMKREDKKTPKITAADFLTPEAYFTPKIRQLHKVLNPEDVREEAHDSLFLRFAADKLTELKRK